MNDSMETIRKVFGYPPSYYNCTGKTYEQWEAMGTKWPILGMLLIAGGTLYIILYMPTVYAMLRLKLIKNDCYKIMFCLILADIGNLFVNSFIAGYVFATGGVFCMNPIFSYFSGSYSYVIWSIASYFYIILALNRLVLVLNNKLLHQAFMSIPINLWIVLGLIYGIWTGRRSIPFNSTAFGALYVPVIEEYSKEVLMYSNIWHVYHNVGVGIIMLIVYAMIFLLLARKRDSNKISVAEMNALLQAVLITVPAILCSWLYVYIQFFQVATLEMAIAAHFSWQTVAGISALIYLTLNHSIRSFYKGNRREVKVSAHIEVTNGTKSPKNTIA